MKKLILVIALLSAFGAHAQTRSWGATARAGAQYTRTTASQPIVDSYTYGPGLQVGLGFWLSQAITANGKLQLTLLQSGTRQRAGEVMLTDPNRNPIGLLNAADYSLALHLSAVYLHQFNQVWAVGAGAAAQYEYFSKTRIHGEITTNFYQGQPVEEEVKDTYDNFNRRKLRLYLPVEVQRQLSDHLTLVGQVQLPLSNRMAASESAFKEKDFGLTIGVNYSLGELL
ncbi:hypothetical protein [Pontibacter chitinilyticus]|uniref:hypothetical protein n=1 Tax=Pontibacter chitinilyticus TaxID=2674989 RepID=UPI00321A544E